MLKSLAQPPLTASSVYISILITSTLVKATSLFARSYDNHPAVFLQANTYSIQSFFILAAIVQSMICCYKSVCVCYAILALVLIEFHSFLFFSLFFVDVLKDALYYVVKSTV